ncbi:MAG: PA2169 family four-helix-bundle protein [Alphaproteobacteria bacterium]|nr:PA2169 family four-helix-bundle protein [Alphaproteobacteria bacterium]
MQNKIDILERLISYTQDSVNGYREAADLVRKDDPGLSGLFEDRLRHREPILDHLRMRLRALDADNDALTSDGTAAGYLHQIFMKFRAAFGNNRKAALAEVERGEKMLIEAFEDARKNAEPELATVISEFLDSIRMDEQSVESMRKSA